MQKKSKNEKNKPKQLSKKMQTGKPANQPRPVESLRTKGKEQRLADPSAKSRTIKHRYHLIQP